MAEVEHSGSRPKKRKARLCSCKFLDEVGSGAIKKVARVSALHGPRNIQANNSGNCSRMMSDTLGHSGNLLDDSLGPGQKVVGNGEANCFGRLN